MPIATPEVYAEMLGRAKENAYAFPAINCVGSESVNAAIKGFADAGSDGIIQFSTGGAEFASGLGVKDMVTGAVALAKFTHQIASKYPINVALHTDHCPKDKLDTYVRPLLDISAKRVAAGKNPLFQSHMWDGSAVPIDENLEIAQELLKAAVAAKIILEIEIGVVGGEEDGVEAEINEKLYTTPEDFEKTVAALGASTCWPPPSATCTASTSPATSSCALTSWTRARRSRRPSWACPTGRSRSTSCSTADRAR
jgi:fructose-bisphosphate aldolase, class II